MLATVMCKYKAVTGHNIWVEIYTYIINRSQASSLQLTQALYSVYCEATLYSVYILSVCTVQCIAIVILNYITSFNILAYLDTWSGFEAAKTVPWPSRELHHCGKFLEPSDK